MSALLSADLNQFLTDLKRFNDAGAIETLGVIATFAVAFIALAPSIWKWKQRPKLAIHLKQPTTRSKPRFTILTTRLMCSALSRSIHGCKSAIIAWQR